MDYNFAMQKIKTITVITTFLLAINQAAAQVPPVPQTPSKQPAAVQQPKVEIHEVKKQTSAQNLQQTKTTNTKSQTKQPVKTDNKLPKQSPNTQQKQVKQTTPQKAEDIKTTADKKPSVPQNTQKKEAKKQENKFKNTFKNLKHKPKTENPPEEQQAAKQQNNHTNKLPQTPQNIKNEQKEIKKETIQPKQEDTKETTTNTIQTTAAVSDIKPSQINDIREQAKFLYNSNKLDEAEQLFNKIPETEKISDDWLFLANIAQDREKPIDAVFLLKKAIAADDNNYKAHYNLGNLYFYDNKINMAMNEYKKAIKLKKDFAYAYYNKGCCYLKKGNWFNARYEFGLAIKANPEEPAFYYNLAYTCKMMKKDKKAKEALEMYNKLMMQ